MERGTASFVSERRKGGEVDITQSKIHRCMQYKGSAAAETMMTKAPCARTKNILNNKK